jgi:hypothetical protein
LPSWLNPVFSILLIHRANLLRVLVKKELNFAVSNNQNLLAK